MARAHVPAYVAPRQFSGVVGRLAVANLLLCASTCVAAPTPPDADGDTGHSVTSRAAATSSPQTPSGDPLLARAQAALVRGELPTDIRAALTTSANPVHARAKRLFAAFDGKAAPQKPELEAPGAAQSFDEAIREARPSATAGAPSLAKRDSASRRGTSPGLTMLTSAELRPEGEGVALVLKGARGEAGVDVGVLLQPESNTARVVARTAAALPAVMRGRPTLLGVRLTDVARGDGTVIFTLALPPGWIADRPRRDRAGARLVFAPQ